MGHIGCNGRISYLHLWKSTTPRSMTIELRYGLQNAGIEPVSSNLAPLEYLHKQGKCACSDLP